MIVGDFNADPLKGRFWKELEVFCSNLSLCVIDRTLPGDSFTYLCPSKNSTSWLDHVLCTQGMVNIVSQVFIDYKSSIYDHFPVFFMLDLYLNSYVLDDKV